MSSITGDKELMRKVGQLKQIQLDRIMKKQAEVVRAAAVYLVPVDTGELRNSIHTDVTHQNGGTQGVVYTNKAYAQYVEFGTGPVGQADHAGISPEVRVSYRQTGWIYYDKRSGQFVRTQGQPARPYMYPALKNNEKKIIRGFRESVDKEIEKVAKS